MHADGEPGLAVPHLLQQQGGALPYITYPKVITALAVEVHAGGEPGLAIPHLLREQRGAPAPAYTT